MKVLWHFLWFLYLRAQDSSVGHSSLYELLRDKSGAWNNWWDYDDFVADVDDDEDDDDVDEYGDDNDDDDDGFLQSSQSERNTKTKTQIAHLSIHKISTHFSQFATGFCAHFSRYFASLSISQIYHVFRAAILHGLYLINC